MAILAFLSGFIGALKALRALGVLNGSLVGFVSPLVNFKGLAAVNKGYSYFRALLRFVTFLFKRVIVICSNNINYFRILKACLKG